MWSPPKHSLLSSGSTKDLLATTGDYLRLWTVNDADNNATNCRATLKNDQQPGIVTFSFGSVFGIEQYICVCYIYD